MRAALSGYDWMVMEGPEIDSKTVTCRRDGEPAEYECQQCHQDLCIGCSFECAGCKRDFCVSHVVVTPIPGQAGLATYSCEDCYGKQGVSEWSSPSSLQ